MALKYGISSKTVPVPRHADNGRAVAAAATAPVTSSLMRNIPFNGFADAVCCNLLLHLLLLFLRLLLLPLLLQKLVAALEIENRLGARASAMNYF